MDDRTITGRGLSGQTRHYSNKTVIEKLYISLQIINYFDDSYSMMKVQLLLWNSSHISGSLKKSYLREKYKPVHICITLHVSIEQVQSMILNMTNIKNVIKSITFGCDQY